MKMGNVKGMVMRKIVCILTIMCIAFTLTSCGAAQAESEAKEENQGTDISGSYEHDPRDNPEAMKDIIENADAVYGFSPNPESTRIGVYAEYDWTDPAFVAGAQEERRAYHESMSSMMDILYEMRAEGASIEEMARAVSTERNRLRLEAYQDDPEGLEKLKQSNLDTYGHEDGPTPDELYEKYGSWELVIQKAFGTNMGMDACCGLYDEYYQLYIELGYVAAEEAPALEKNASPERKEEALADENDFMEYTLEQVVVLSRHNLRAPLSSNGSVPDELTPHDWIEWSAGSSELTLKGGIEETSMGQYFRKWLEQEKLIPENYIPEEGEIRFNARAKQRCIATSRYFAAGMLPLAEIEVEYPGDENGTVDVMQPVLHYYSDDYAADVMDQVAAQGGDAGFDGLARQNRDVIRLIMDTVDMLDSEVYQSGKYGDLLADPFGYTMEGVDTEPDLTGAIKPAYQVADALILQYYEEPDAVRAAFGHDLTEEDWAKLGAFMTTCLRMKHGAPLVAANITNPLLRELKSELQNKDRKFSFFCAHDCTVLGTLTALGATAYTLPASIETETPVGVKLVFERRRDAEGQAWYRVSLIYRSTEQIRSGEMLTLQNPPLRYDLSFEGVETNADGLISEADLFDLFDCSIAVLDGLEDIYSLADAA